MATVMTMQWQGIGGEDYDRVAGILGLDTNPPDGAILHVAGVDGETLRVTDVWESREDFERFLASRLMPAIEEAGLGDRERPEISFFEARNYARGEAQIPDWSAYSPVIS